MSHALVSLRKAYPQDAAALIEMMKEDDDGMFNEQYVDSKFGSCAILCTVGIENGGFRS